MSAKFADITVFCIIPLIHAKAQILFNYSPRCRWISPHRADFLLPAALTPLGSLLLLRSLLTQSPHITLSL